MIQRRQYVIVDGNGNYLGDTLTPRTFETAIKFNSALEAETFLKYSTSHLNYIGSLMMTTSFFSINEIVTTDTSVRSFQSSVLAEIFHISCREYISSGADFDISFKNMLERHIQSIIWYGFVNIEPDVVHFICEDPRCEPYIKDMPAAMRDNPEMFKVAGVFSSDPAIRSLLYMCSSTEHIRKYSLSTAK